MEPISFCSYLKRCARKKPRWEVFLLWSQNRKRQSRRGRAGSRGLKMEDDFLRCSYGLRVSETRGALSSGLRFVMGAKGGGQGGIGHSRGEKQRMGEGRRKAFPGGDPFSAVPPL